MERNNNASSSNKNSVPLTQKPAGMNNSREEFAREFSGNNNQNSSGNNKQQSSGNNKNSMPLKQMPGAVVNNLREEFAQEFSGKNNQNSSGNNNKQSTQTPGKTNSTPNRGLEEFSREFLDIIKKNIKPDNSGQQRKK
ncbi:hypothetical protein [Paenisporosarcina sp. TG20]|uniref:hypothetical protein n=1 Tax=Paenisporosarcina sp. TG20 TaxID=1211706 RepID=UPI0003181635|nr:hypothetical protein [Paenisporosarcina sp. TG20]